MIAKLLTEQEVAELLRCSRSKVKRWRLSGKLPYMKGRPIFILEADVKSLIEAERKRSVEQCRKKARESETAFQGEAAKEWAARQVLRRRLRQRK